MRIALVRGPSLNEWEMQNWLPLAARHELLLVGSNSSKFNPSTSLRTRVQSSKLVKPLCLGEVFGQVPFGIKVLNGVLGDPRLIWNLEGIIRGLDIVCTAELRSYYSLQAIRAKGKGLVKKVVVTVWENIPFLGDRDKNVKKIKEEVKAGADLFLAVTNQAREMLITEGVDGSKIAVIGMGVDQRKFRTGPVSRFIPVSTRKTFVDVLSAKSMHVVKKKFLLRAVEIPFTTATRSKRKINILSVGRLVPEKGFSDIVRAMAILEKGKLKGKFRLTIIGDGPEEVKLREMTVDQGLSGVITFKKANYQKMPEIYNMADIFVLASRPTEFWQEQYGMVLVEAASCGLPIVATSTGTISEVLGGKGLFFEPGDFWQLAKLLAKLADETLRQRVGRRMSAFAKDKFDCEKVAKVLEKTLVNL